MDVRIIQAAKEVEDETASLQTNLPLKKVPVGLSGLEMKLKIEMIKQSVATLGSPSSLALPERLLQAKWLLRYDTFMLVHIFCS